MTNTNASKRSVVY